MKKAVILIFIVLLGLLKARTQTLQSGIVMVSFRESGQFPLEEEINLYSSNSIEKWMKEKRIVKAVLGSTKEGRSVEACYFPGRSDKKALIIGGVHGSELSSVEIAGQLIELLSSGEKPYYNVIIIPVLFPDNAAKAMRSIQQKTNFGRYTTEESIDPNRQMPQPGKAFNPELPVDIYGRTIENENQFLLQLIQEYSPSRIINLHAIRDVTKAGIYADPRTDCNGYALGFMSDSSLAVSMAGMIEKEGGIVPGNNLKQIPTALYYHDPEIALEGLLQKRNFEGSALPGKRGYGASLGGWATSAVCDELGQRDAARLITVEFPGYQPSSAYEGDAKADCILNMQLYVNAIRKIFLEENFVE